MTAAALAHCHLPDPRLGRDVSRYVITEGDLQAFPLFVLNTLYIGLGASKVHIDGEPSSGDLFGIVPGRTLSVDKRGGLALAVHFLPGGASRLFGLDVSGMDQVFGLDAPMPQAGLEAIADAVRATTGTPEDMVACLDRALVVCLSEREPEGIVERAHEAIMSHPSPSELDLARLAEDLGTTPRTLQRHYRRRYGITMAREVRLRRLWASAVVTRFASSPWREVPGHFGYVDQSHFLRDARELLGSSLDALHTRFRLDALFYPRGEFRPETARRSPFEVPEWVEHYERLPGADDWISHAQAGA